MGQCQPSGHLKSNNVSSVTFDPSSGIANFSNFYINASGMYILMVNVRGSSGSSSSASCYSEPIVVKSAFNALTVDTSSAPNFYLNFSGDYTQLSTDQLKQMKSYFYNCVVQPHNIITTDTLFIYKGSVMFSAFIDPSTSSSALQSLYSYLQSSEFLNLYNGLKFNSATINNVVVSAKDTTTNSSSSQVPAVVWYYGTTSSTSAMSTSSSSATTSDASSSTAVVKVFLNAYRV